MRGATTTVAGPVATARTRCPNRARTGTYRHRRWTRNVGPHIRLVRSRALIRVPRGDLGDQTLPAHRAAQALRHVCGEHEGRPVGRCQIAFDDDTTCGGPLFPDRYGLMRVHCARCGETWDQDDLRRLGLVLES